jgi:hypothetical protein
MGLRDVAEADLAVILEDDECGFGWSINLTDPQGTSEDFTGFSGNISAAIDPETGVPISGQLAHFSLRLSSIIGAGLEVPRGEASETVKPWLAKFDDIDGVNHTYKVKFSDPDYTLGIVVGVLEVYDEGAP